jgi:hypothetical protein
LGWRGELKREGAKPPLKFSPPYLEPSYHQAIPKGVACEEGRQPLFKISSPSPTRIKVKLVLMNRLERVHPEGFSLKGKGGEAKDGLSQNRANNTLTQSEDYIID